jgi:hypothetical protein
MPKRRTTWDTELRRLEYHDQKGAHRIPMSGGSVGGATVSGSDPIVVTGSVVSFEPGSPVDFLDEEIVNVRIENRTSDPGSPSEGRIWLRTDL